MRVKSSGGSDTLLSAAASSEGSAEVLTPSVDRVAPGAREAVLSSTFESGDNEGSKLRSTSRGWASEDLLDLDLDMDFVTRAASFPVDLCGLVFLRGILKKSSSVKSVTISIYERNVLVIVLGLNPNHELT